MMAFSGVRISWLTRARNSDFWLEARSAARFAASSSALDPLPVRDVAQHGAEAAALLAGDAAHGHEERDRAGAGDGLHLAAFVQEARDAVVLQAGEIVERELAAVGRQKLAERPPLHLVRIEPEERFGAAIDAFDRALARRG